MPVARRIFALLAFVVVAVYLGLSVWAASGPEAESVVASALVDGTDVLVNTDPWLTFAPVGGSDVGLVLYPGARVPPAAYAPLARRIAQRGYVVVIPDMPLGLSFLASGVAEKVMTAHQEVDRWVVGGHSLGGAMAVSFIDDHPGSVRGLLLWAAYPAASVDVSDEQIFATAISGTADGLVSFRQVSEARSRLPLSYEIVPIEGGNHSGFGAYGPQEGDGEATIDREDQWNLIVEASVRLLERVRFG